MPIYLDALYLKPNQNGVSYAFYEEKILSPDFKNQWGARLAIGGTTSHDGFQISTQFLHYHARIRHARIRHARIRSEETLGVFSHLWRLHLGVFDLFLSRYLPISSCVSLTPFCGVSYGEIRHKIKQDSDFISMKNKFWGIGPMVGVKGNWSFSSWCSLYMQSTFRLLSGRFYVHQDVGNINFLEEFFQMASVLETFLGFQVCWKSFFMDTAFALFLFPKQNQLAHFATNGIPGNYITNQGDLSLCGLSLGLGMYF